MIKELLLAIILGAFLGFGVTGGFFALNKNKTNSSIASSNSSELNVVPTTTQGEITDTQEVSSDSSSINSTHNITITNPEDESVVNNSKITITGTTTKNSMVIITTPLNTYNTTTNNNGNFEIDVELESGFNQIKITSIDSDDNIAESEMNVTYSTAKL